MTDEIQASERWTAAEAQELCELLEADPKNWTRAIARVGQLAAETDSESAWCDQVLDTMVEEMLPAYEDKWTERVEGLLRTLGLEGLHGGVGLDSVLDPYLYEGGWPKAARVLARSNLEKMVTDGHTFANTYTREMISMGWRDSYILGLIELVNGSEGRPSEGRAVIERIVNEGYPSPERRALLRSEVVSELREIGSHFSSPVECADWIISQLDHGFWWALLTLDTRERKKATRKIRGKKQLNPETAPVGATLFVAALVERLD